MPFLALIPAKVWFAIFGVILLGLGYWKITSDAENKGAATVTTKILQEQTHAQDRAEVERRKLDKGDDSAARGFDRD